MTLSSRQIREIRDLLQGRVVEHAQLSRYTSFRIGGPADLLAEPGSRASLGALARFLREEGIPRVILGRGTNVLFSDAGFRGVVVRTGSLNECELHTNGSGVGTFTVAAGVSLPFVVARSYKLGFAGLEGLWGIPGSFGGAVVTNAGVGSTSVGDCLAGVTVLTVTGEEQTVRREDLDYGYRSVTLPSGSLVVEGTIRLRREGPDAIRAGLAQAKARRRGKQPRGVASAGCVFKNPDPENPAGAIIDRLGLKGCRVGDAQVSEVHANFIVNRGRARAGEVLELVEMIRTRVREREHVDLSLEIHVIREEAPDG